MCLSALEMDKSKIILLFILHFSGLTVFDLFAKQRNIYPWSLSFFWMMSASRVFQSLQIKTDCNTTGSLVSTLNLITPKSFFKFHIA